MLLRNRHPDYAQPLLAADADALGLDAALEMQRFLRLHGTDAATPVHTLPALARELAIGAIHIKDEGSRLGLGSFKALGGAYAVVRLVLAEATRQLCRDVDVAEWRSPEITATAKTMVFGCATDGNHGRSVAQGAQMVGARAVIFVHSGVSRPRIEAIARFGAEVVRVDGTYDDSVAEASRVCAVKGWTVVSDTSWPGYETIPRLVMQGYTAMVHEALAVNAKPTHVFVQAGVGGLAAAVAGHLASIFGDGRPSLIVVEPDHAACLHASMRAGRSVKIPHDAPTVMAMLECYEPSLVAWHILTRVADAFMTVDDAEAVAVMNRLAHPRGDDPPIVAGESGGVGLAGLIRVAGDAEQRRALGLDANARVFVINTEGATDPERYRQLVSESREPYRPNHEPATVA